MARGLRSPARAASRSPGRQRRAPAETVAASTVDLVAWQTKAVASSGGASWSRRLPVVSSRAASATNMAIPVLLVCHGVAVRGWPWLHHQLHTFAILIFNVVVFCSGMQWVCVRYGARLQPDRKHAFVDGDAKAFRLLREEVLETTRCMWCVSCMAAWPLLRHAAGEPTGLIWTLEEIGSTLPQYSLGFLVGIPAADAWLYVKHRLLHTRCLWAFHSHHHAFRNPTAFGGFAVSPLESLWTFCPILLWSHLPHWIPLVMPSIFFFFLLNTYLHSGFSFALLERVLPLLMIDSSAYHNVHHEKGAATQRLKPSTASPPASVPVAHPLRVCACATAIAQSRRTLARSPRFGTLCSARATATP